jgi:predicted Fe-Mo cluster-binding NifX family protein
VKIAVSAFGTNLEAPVDSRFGRCPYFVIVDTDNMQFEAVPNVSKSTPSGAGIQAAQTIASKDVKTLLTGNIGPNAYQALSAAGIKIVTGVSGTVIEAITKYKKGELKESNSPTVSEHLGFGKGRGMGRGRRRN